MCRPPAVNSRSAALEQPRVMREAELAAEEVRAVRAVAVGLPEDVVRPVQGLHPGVAGPAGVRADQAAVEQGQERLHLVPLRVVDRVPGGHGQRGRHPGGRAAQRVHRAHRGVHRVRGERLLRALHRHQPGVPGVGELTVEELEPGRRLDVGQLQVGDVDQAEQRPRAWRAAAGSGPAPRSSRSTCGSPAMISTARYGALAPRRSTVPGASRRWVVSGGRPALKPRSQPRNLCSPQRKPARGQAGSSARRGCPRVSSAASEVGSWAMIVVSPRSTVTRLVAPRNVMAMTVPASGPDRPSSPGPG